jgi:hypothetical protein
MVPPKNNNNNSVAAAVPRPGEDKVARAYAQIRSALKGLSNREVLAALRASAGEHNLVVSPAGLIQQQQRAAVTSPPKGKRNAAGGSGSKPNPANKDPKVLECKKKLEGLKTQVLEAAKAAKVDRLPADHHLVVEKARVEEELRSFRASGASAAAPAVASGSKNPQ